MMTKDTFTSKIVIPYILVASIYLLAEIFGFAQLRFALKPCLLIPLIIGVWFYVEKYYRIYLVLALIFSWLGDVLLLFVEQNQLYFLLGLGAFFMAHIFYIVLFRRIISSNSNTNPTNIVLLVIAVLFYDFVLTSVLWVHLGDLKYPVLLYSIVLSGMLFTALIASKQLNSSSKIQLIIGAILFVISDSLLAINKFYLPFQAASIMIMFSYIAAQYLIVLAIINIRKVL